MYSNKRKAGGEDEDTENYDRGVEMWKMTNSTTTLKPEAVENSHKSQASGPKEAVDFNRSWFKKFKNYWLVIIQTVLALQSAIEVLLIEQEDLTPFEREKFEEFLVLLKTISDFEKETCTVSDQEKINTVRDTYSYMNELSAGIITPENNRILIGAINCFQYVDV